ncbi:alternative oxidase-domain-containing protein [Blastocladiella britannica]|nr:alternative oxidase-domain-containing protein [Blastocladiella britannica]
MSKLTLIRTTMSLTGRAALSRSSLHSSSSVALFLRNSTAVFTRRTLTTDAGTSTPNNGNKDGGAFRARGRVAETHPRPMRPEFETLMTAERLQSLDIGVEDRHVPDSGRDRTARRLVKGIRVISDLFFREKYLHRAVILETVAGVPGMVAAMLRHLQSIRHLKHDGGWIAHLLHEAENERMHLMTFMKLSQPSLPERMLVAAVQGVYFKAFSILYLSSPATAHRFVGYLEEEAVSSYTCFLAEIDAGRVENVPAPEIAIRYWNLAQDARLREVVLAVRADEAVHRDTNHHLADCAVAGTVDLRKEQPSPPPSPKPQVGAGGEDVPSVKK